MSEAQTLTRETAQAAATLFMGKAPTPPCNVEAETALLGCMLYDNAAYERIGDYLQPQHFYEPFFGEMFRRMVEMIRRGQVADAIALHPMLESWKAYEECGGIRFLADLIDKSPPMANAPDYARTIWDLARRRELMRLGGEMIADAGSAMEVERSSADMIEAAESALYSLAEKGEVSQGFQTFETAAASAILQAAEAFQRDGGLAGLSTGLIDLDAKLGGLHPSDLVIIAARPSMGKSALAVNIGSYAARTYAYEPAPDGSRRTINGGRVAIFSLEMSAEQVSLRILAEISGVSSDRIRKGEIDAVEFGRLRDAAHELASMPLHIDDTGALSIAKLAARARRLKRQHGLDLIIVDYLQLVTGAMPRRDGNRVQEVSEITQALKALAKELDVPVIALAQLSRQVENREDKRPQLSDLRESGSIEQDADMVLFIYREAYYLARTEPREGTPEHLEWLTAYEQVSGLADLIVGKQRHGPIGVVPVAFNEDLTKFGNLARESRYGAYRSGGATGRSVTPD